MCRYAECQGTLGYVWASNKLLLSLSVDIRKDQEIFIPVTAATTNICVKPCSDPSPVKGGISVWGGLRTEDSGILKLGPDNNQLNQLNQGHYAMGQMGLHSGEYEMKSEQTTITSIN